MSRETSLPELCPLLGESEAMDSLRDFIVGVSLIHRPVLLLGANGTGKSLAAQKIHAVGRTAQAPFMHVDCATNSERELEEILFDPSGDGVTSGLLYARTGATCYLSNIESLTPLLERALLRHVLDDRNEGDRCTRVIAGSHYSLSDLIDGEFLDVSLIECLSRYRTSIPPLRDRVEDIPILCHYQLWLQTPSDDYDETWERFQHDMLPCLLHYPWPGNIDELNQLVQSYCEENGGGDPSPAHEFTDLNADPESDPAAYLSRQFRQWAREFEQEVRSGRWTGWADPASTRSGGEIPDAAELGSSEVVTGEERWTLG